MKNRPFKKVLLPYPRERSAVRWAMFCVLLGALPLVTPRAGSARPLPVAIVFQLEGSAQAIPVRGVAVEVRRFDVLRAGTELRVATGGSLSIAFASGARFVLGSGARATVAPHALGRTSGTVVTLASVSPFAVLAPIDPLERPGDRAAAVRLRAEPIGNLAPNAGARTLAARTVLRFEPVEGAERYRVEVRAADGALVFETETTAAVVVLPARTLAPRRRYRWTIETLDRLGPKARGEASFETLDAATIDALGLSAELMGAVVEGVPADYPAARAGVVVGDVLLAWSRAANPPANPVPASGLLAAPFDLEGVRSEQGPRGLVTLFGLRDGKPHAWALPPGWWWALGVRWPGQDQKLRLAEDPQLAAWVEFRRAQGLPDGASSVEAAASFRTAAERLGPLDRPLEAAIVLAEECRAHSREHDFDRAADCYERARRQTSKLGPSALIRAWLATGEASIAQRRGDPARAQKLLSEAVALWEVQAPASDQLSYTLNTAGVLAAERGDLAEAEESWRRALEIQERLAPVGPTRWFLQSNLGMVRFLRGDLDAAEADLTRVLQFHREVQSSIGQVTALVNLADIARARGDLAVAQADLRQALALVEAKIPRHPLLLETLAGLGAIERSRGDFRAAASTFERILARHLEAASESEDVARTLVELGEIAARAGDLSRARERLRQALTMREKLGATGFLLAQTLLAMGRMEARAGGDLSAAAVHFEQALARAEAQLPESLLVSEALFEIGQVAERRGDLAKAEASLRRALDLRSAISPASGLEAEALSALGRVEIARGARAAGLDYACRAIDGLDRLRPRVGGTPENGAAFEAAATDAYRLCVGALVDAGRFERAFEALERGRARSYLQLLSERSLRFSELPAPLRVERARLDREHDGVQASLATLSLPRDRAEVDRLLDALHDVRTRQSDWAERVRRESPRLGTRDSLAPLAPLARLALNTPLGFEDARESLDAGTLLLSYSVGEEKTLLFVVTSVDDRGPRVEVHTLPLGRAALVREIASFRALLRDPAASSRSLRAAGERLFNSLLRPAKRQLTSARRLLISPDGPLHALPFAALAHRNRWLVERWPLHFTTSISIYASRTSPRLDPLDPLDRRAIGSVSERLPFVGFGDPSVPKAESVGGGGGEPQLLLATERGLALSPLPAARREVEQIAKLFGGSLVFVGEQATEEQAKTLAPRARVLHFATHGLLDERLPLHSGLALAIPEAGTSGPENGLLQAWEIFETLRLDADLVTLSACDTALGQDAGGEGILGLTRAFQFAGARSVLSTLWSVADDSTPELMRRFYTHLQAGQSKDESLRQAQIELLRSKDRDLAHPYRWAGFQLYGGWQ